MKITIIIVVGIAASIRLWNSITEFKSKTKEHKERKEKIDFQAQKNSNNERFWLQLHNKAQEEYRAIVLWRVLLIIEVIEVLIYSTPLFFI